jgi:acyl-CoA-binding protein
MAKFNLDLKNIIGVASLVSSLVKTAQSLKGKTGEQKHDIVVDQVKQLLPAIEGVTGRDIADNVKYEAALDNLVKLEKAVIVARAEFAALVEDIKAKSGK